VIRSVRDKHRLAGAASALLIVIAAAACAGPSGSTVPSASSGPSASTGPSALTGASTTPASVSALPTTTPLDGKWSTSFTRDELAASPLLMDPEELNDENWGEETLTLQDGQVTFTQQNDIDSTSASGTFLVSGDVVLFSFTEGVVVGETFGFRWSLDGDTLTFTRANSLVGPTPYLVKPWTRVH
jgi:hypothetical protein